jgi:hypothetical protein
MMSWTMPLNTCLVGCRDESGLSHMHRCAGSVTQQQGQTCVVLGDATLEVDTLLDSR